MYKDKTSLPLFFHSTLLFCFLLASFLTWFLIDDSQEKSIKLSETHYSRFAYKIISTQPKEDIRNIIQKEQQIKGLLILNKKGDTLFHWGRITKDPRLIPPPLNKDVSFSKKENLFYIDLQTKAFFPIKKSVEPTINIHMEILDEKLVRWNHLKNWLYFIIESLLIASYILAIFLYNRSFQLKKELDEQKTLATLGTALRTLTHEMKNPLAIISLQTNYLSKKYKNLEIKDLTLIEDEVERLSRLMTTVREYLKPAPLSESPLNIKQFFETVKQGYSSQIKWRIPEQDLYINFDRDRFRSVIDNLLNNAIESGSELNHISLRVTPKRKNIQILISDKGKGMSKDLQKKIFDPFFTTKTTGSGAGLMIVKQFLDEKGSKLEIESQEEEGSVISFLLKQYKNPKESQK